MMGMSPNIIMTMYDLCVYDMVGLRTCVYTFQLFIIYCGAVELWDNANTRLQGIRFKVSEHDGGAKPGTLNHIWMQLCVVC